MDSILELYLTFQKWDTFLHSLRVPSGLESGVTRCLTDQKKNLVTNSLATDGFKVVEINRSACHGY